MDAIQTVPVTLNVPKESKDVVDLLASLVSDIKAKKSATEIAADALPKLIAAFDGYAAIPAEAQSQYKSDLGAYVTKSVGGALGL